MEEVTPSRIVAETKKDPTLQSVMKHIYEYSRECTAQVHTMRCKGSTIGKMTYWYLEMEVFA